MAKDPAFLFYSQDFYTGVATMSFEDRGKYISILCLMHQQGRMDEETIRFLVGSVSVTLKSKFEVDENGLWYNERLEEETEKRIKFTESRRLNGSKGGRPKPSGYPNGKPTDNHIEDEDIVSSNKVDKEKKERTTVKENSTKAQFNPLDYIPDHWNGDLFLVEWDDFMSSRKKKKWSCTEKVLKERLIQLRKVSGDDWGVAMPIMQKSSERGYAEFFAIDSKQSQNQPIKNERREPVRDKA